MSPRVLYLEYAIQYYKFLIWKVEKVVDDMAEKDSIGVLTEKELEVIVEKACYQAANSACSNLYDGLAKRFMYEFEGDLGSSRYEFEQLNRN